MDEVKVEQIDDTTILMSRTDDFTFKLYKKEAVYIGDLAYKVKEQVKIQEAYEERRKQLISNLSNDLRTPLASVVGYSELLLNGLRENENGQRYL